MPNISLARLAPLIVPVALASLIAGGAAPAQGASFTVNATHDAVDASPGDGVCADAGGACTLRAAVMETNALAGADEISLPAGTYVLSIAGAGEDAAATGDLDIGGDLTVVGAGSGVSSIDADQLDRVIDIPSGRLAVISGLTVQNGAGPEGDAFFGAGIFNSGGLTVLDASIINNSATSGGGVWSEGSLTIRTSVISDNDATSFGGGLFNSGRADLEGVSFSRNTAGFGGGISHGFTGELFITSSTLNLNSADQEGGGLFLSGMSTLRAVSISDNEADRGGGIFFHNGISSVLDSSITGNAAAIEGGGIRNVISLVSVEGTTLSANTAPTGGGIANSWPSSLTLVNGTVSGNSATLGAGIANLGQAGLSLTNVTVAFNGGAGVSSGGGSPQLTNTIIASNQGGDCVRTDQLGGFDSRGHNLDSDGSCGFTASGDISDVEPLIQPLADNGGPTQTHALIQGGCPSDACIVPSPAIDAGDSATCPGTDQRGEPRPFDGDGDGLGECDIGAYEVQEPPLTCTGPCGPIPTSSPTAPASPTPAPTSSPTLPVTLPATGGDAASPSAIPLALAGLAAIAIAVVGGAAWRARRRRR